MHSQLNYIIAKQRHAELVQNAGRAELIADAKTRRTERQPVRRTEVLPATGQRSGCAPHAERESRSFVER